MKLPHHCNLGTREVFVPRYRHTIRHETHQECGKRMYLLYECHKSSHMSKMAAAISKQAQHIPTRSQVNENVKLSLDRAHTV